MDLTSLAKQLPPEKRPQLESLHQAYLQADGEDELGAFLAYAHDNGLLELTEIQRLLTLRRVEVRLLDQARGDDSPRAVALLGKGAMGEVHIARDPVLGRAVAVKRIVEDHSASQSITQRFLVEAQITAQLSHPGIVPVYALREDAGGERSYSMELVCGRTLTEVMADVRARYDGDGELRPEDTLAHRLELFPPICDALAYAHERGVLHRDLKPDNIMVGAFHRVLVMDWGIAKLLDTPEEPVEEVYADGSKLTLTRYGSILGTPQYMSPEQARGENDFLDARSDQFSLGIILHELIGLRSAVTGTTSLEVVTKVAAAERRPLVPYHRSERIAPELEAIVAKATAAEPRQRYPSVADLGEDVRRFLRNEEVLARPDPPLAKVMRWISRHRAAALATGLALVLAAIVVAGIVYLRGAAALEEQREAAQLREVKLSQMVSQVVRQTQQIDATLRRFEALLAGIAFAAEQALSTPPGQEKLYLREDFRDPKRAPPDLREAPVYQNRVSAGWPSMTLAPGVTPASVGTTLRQLAGLRSTFRRALLWSHSWEALALDDKQQDGLILDQGTPLLWAYFGSREGIMAGLPGGDVLPADYDPRKRDWYTAAAPRRDLFWGPTVAAVRRKGQLMTCSVAVRDARGELLGIAAVDLTVDYVIERLLAADIAAGGEAFLVDGEGRILVRTSQRHLAHTAKTHELQPFPYPALLERIRSGDGPGHHVLTSDGGEPELAVWSFVRATGWVYLVMGREAVLTGSTASHEL